MSLWNEAACVETHAALFTSVAAAAPSRRDLAAAKAVCRSCPARPTCLSFALTEDEPGVWGGLDRTERARVRRSAPVARF